MTDTLHDEQHCDQQRRTSAHAGLAAYHDGQAAETSVERLYLSMGYRLKQRRWRGKSGEIDLVFETSDQLVFVEVKKSSSFDRAMESLRPRQIQRLIGAAEEYAGKFSIGSLTEMRFDVALVNGQGEVKIMENAFA